LAALKDGFVAWLTGLGYVSTGLTGQRALFDHLDRWLDATGRGLGDLTPVTLEQFLQARRAEGHVTKLTNHGLEPLVGYLEHLRLYASPVAKMTAVDEIVGRFGQHLANERALGEGTANLYMHVARRFLAARPQPLEVSLAELAPGDVTGFVLERSQQLSVAAMQSLVSAMRALLRFFYVTGLTDRLLAAAVPTVARRREVLPRALSDEHVEQLLKGCDRTTAVGIRDFAILTVLARLGLRCGEVAALQLDDIDWVSGAVRIRGKGPRHDNLPLPADVGEALVAYLRTGRPDCADRRVFVRSFAPRRGLSRQAVGGLVRAASVRAGLVPHGPHRLRHTVATGLLREGAPLSEIAQLLRHRSVQATAIYAKVDLDALSGLVQPWPGTAR
jgi:site-specific recombinase XerD